jgi:hypothetical protein
VTGSVKHIVSPKFLMGVGSLVAGYYGAQYGLKYARKAPGISMIPSTGPLGYLGDVVLVGASSALLGMASKTAGSAFLVGGTFGILQRAVAQYVLPMVGLSGMMGCMNGGCMGDYLTPGDAAAARPLGYFGDYLTPGDAAAARPLGSFADDDVGEELAAL